MIINSKPLVIRYFVHRLFDKKIIAVWALINNDIYIITQHSNKWQYKLKYSDYPNYFAYCKEASQDFIVKQGIRLIDDYK